MPTVECIHGLEASLCDICTPRVTPEPDRSRVSRPVRVTSTGRTGAGPSGVRTSTAARSTGAAPRATAAPALPSVDLASQRGYHLTTIDNLERIVAAGALRSDATPVRDLSSAAARELRATTALPDGSSVGDRVAFYLTPDATRWRELLDGGVGPTWSDEARRVRPSELVALAVATRSLGDDAVLTDGDASATLTRFALVGADRAAATMLLRRLHAAEGGPADAELLGPAEVPLDAVVLMVVSNDPAREAVRRILGAAGLRTKVAVNPPWFAPAG